MADEPPFMPRDDDSAKFVGTIDAEVLSSHEPTPLEVGKPRFQGSYDFVAVGETVMVLAVTKRSPDVPGRYVLEYAVVLQSTMEMVFVHELLLPRLDAVSWFTTTIAVRVVVDESGGRLFLSENMAFTLMCVAAFMQPESAYVAFVTENSDVQRTGSNFAGRVVGMLFDAPTDTVIVQTRAYSHESHLFTFDASTGRAIRQVTSLDEMLRPLLYTAESEQGLPQQRAERHDSAPPGQRPAVLRRGHAADASLRRHD